MARECAWNLDRSERLMRWAVCQALATGAGGAGAFQRLGPVAVPAATAASRASMAAEASSKYARASARRWLWCSSTAAMWWMVSITMGFTSAGTGKLSVRTLAAAMTGTSFCTSAMAEDTTSSPEATELSRPAPPTKLPSAPPTASTTLWKTLECWASNMRSWADSTRPPCVSSEDNHVAADASVVLLIRPMSPSADASSRKAASSRKSVASAAASPPWARASFLPLEAREVSTESGSSSPVCSSWQPPTVSVYARRPASKAVLRCTSSSQGRETT